MSEKSRIKNAFVKRKYSESFASQSGAEKAAQCSFFFPICFGIFVLHWIIVYPLVFGMLYRTVYTKNWPKYWPQLFWTVALVLYLISMTIFLICWRRRKLKKTKMAANPEAIALESSKKMKTLDSIEEESDQVTLRRHPPPLVMEKEEKIEGNVEEKNEDNLSRVSREINRSSIKEYLKIVTVETPSPGEGKTCGTPMTPRDLFFIDLIKNAEREEEIKEGRRSGNVFRYDDERLGRTSLRTGSVGGDGSDETKTQGKRENYRGTSSEVGNLEVRLIEEIKSKQKSGAFGESEVKEENSSEGRNEDDDDRDRREGERNQMRGDSGEKGREVAELDDELTGEMEREEIGATCEDKKKKLRRMNDLESDLIEEIKIKQKSDDFYGFHPRRSDLFVDEEKFEDKSQSSVAKTSGESGEPKKWDLSGGNVTEESAEDEDKTLMQLKDMRIVSTQKKLIDDKFSEFPEIKPRIPHPSRQRATYVEVTSRRKTNFNDIGLGATADEKILRAKKVDTRRYTMGSGAFKDLLGESKSKRRSKSETTLTHISEQKEEIKKNND